MRDKLIQILQKHTPRAMGGVYIETADEILAAIQCNACRHWDSLEGGICFSETSPMNGSDMTVRPHDFCSHWKPKA